MSDSGNALQPIRADALDIERRRRGSGFAYFSAKGTQIRDPQTLARIRSLAIPPAYTDVRIASQPTAHLQAIGRDVAGRLQYRYHPDWDVEREARKAERLAEIIKVLPRIRAAVRRDVASPALSRRKALAAAVAIIDETHIRVGGEIYLESNGAHGAATLLKRQVRLSTSGMTLCFRGKGGNIIRCAVIDRQLARAIRRIATLPGRRLLQYRDDNGAVKTIRSDDINAYLKRISGRDISAKDFRMLAASAAATEQLASLAPARSERMRRRQVAEVMRLIAAELANTPAVVRKSYVHAMVVKAFEDGVLPSILRRTRAGRQRSRGESALARLMAVNAAEA
ncbi:DNA topoisomerase IB [Mesorhizobium sp. BR1-1-16]|uniref:DNA topoisomerase IB n=1 Tax=Mesorhizobium sp. BR1-1-16 TaxID=2876653 RepID=UPI001CCF72D5|nr:DNA topoisomerase IB [Mesorhizobium sp. BR1-1-16]MBZ9938872.1 DNA topoisomerase IB [Mesorhizobium sp. BR1-1-16]